MGGYLKYLAFRILNAILVLLIVTFIISALFVKVAEQSNRAKMYEELMQWERTEGSKIKQSQGLEAFERAKAEKQASLEKKYELNIPYWQKVYRKAVRTLRLDFGTTGMPIFGTNKVSDIIKVALPRSVILFTTATIIVIILGIFLGGLGPRGTPAVSLTGGVSPSSHCSPTVCPCGGPG